MRYKVVCEEKEPEVCFSQPQPFRYSGLDSLILGFLGFISIFGSVWYIMANPLVVLSFVFNYTGWVVISIIGIMIALYTLDEVIFWLR
jgi:hypothetical protein